MVEVDDSRGAHGLITRRASSVAAIFSRLSDDDVPLPLVARELARYGVPVFPCAPDGKRPIPSGGFHEATTDARQVEAWWRQRPRANLAIPTGAASGVVVDVDVHEVDGFAAFGRAVRSGLLPEPLAVVTTPTGGRHLYYPADAEREQRSWQVGRAGIDFRGDGGYIIVPPSLCTIGGYPASYRIVPLPVGWSRHWRRSVCATFSTRAQGMCPRRNHRAAGR